MNNGKKANRTGGKLENFVENALKGCGYLELRDKKAQTFTNRASIVGKRFLKQVPVGQTIYQTPRMADFVVLNQTCFPEGLIIECKWQQASGSVDEKYPFLLLNIRKTGVPTIIILDGGGYKPGAEEWLKNEASENKLLRGVWTMTKFQKRINDGFFD